MNKESRHHTSDDALPDVGKSTVVNTDPEPIEKQAIRLMVELRDVIVELNSYEDPTFHLIKEAIVEQLVRAAGMEVGE